MVAAGAVCAGAGPKWEVRAAPAKLSFFQRLMAEVTLHIDSDLFRGRTAPLTLNVEITDSTGKVTRSGGELNPARMELDKSAAVDYTWSAFFLPGEYHGRAGFDGEWKDFTVKAAGLRNDPLKDAWQDLPAVEFLTSLEPPELWFLPEIRHQLNLPRPRMPVEVVINMSAPELRGRRRTSWNGPMVGPLIRVLAGLPDTHLTLIDTVRQKVLARDASWDAVRTAMNDASGGAVDVKALEHRKSGLRFLTNELKLHTSAKTLIFVSNPVEFDSGQEKGERLDKPADLRVFYIRPRSGITLAHRIEFRPHNEPTLDPADFGIGMPHPVTDQLEPVLKPLAPKVIEITDPAQMRKALAAILDEIAARTTTLGGNTRTA